MHEEFGNYWAAAKQHVLEQRRGLDLCVLEHENTQLRQSPPGFAACLLGEQGAFRGLFTLARSNNEVVLEGRYYPEGDCYFRFRPRPIAKTATWRDLLAFVHRVIDSAPHFPPDLMASARPRAG